MFSDILLKYVVVLEEVWRRIVRLDVRDDERGKRIHLTLSGSLDRGLHSRIKACLLTHGVVLRAGVAGLHGEV